MNPHLPLIAMALAASLLFLAIVNHVNLHPVTVSQVPSITQRIH